MDSVLGRTIDEKLSPVEEKVQSSTPEMRAPSETGKEERTWAIFIECITTDLRSPWGSAAPSSVVNFFCWKMERSASADGAQVPRCFCRQRSLSEALMDTTTFRLSGCSGLATAKLLPSPRAASADCACSAMSMIWEAAVGADCAAPWRTDIARL